MNLEDFIKNVPQTRSKFVEQCHRHGAVLYGDFLLKSGRKTNAFFNSGVLTDCESFDILTDLLVAKLIESKIEFNGLMGCPYKAIPIVSVMSLKYNKLTGKKVNFGYFRKEEKSHGEGQLFVGSSQMYDENARLVVVDDVLTTGSSSQQTLSVLKNTKAKVVCVLYLLNREPNYGVYARICTLLDIRNPPYTPICNNLAFKNKLQESNIDMLEVIRLDEIIDTTSFYTT